MDVLVLIVDDSSLTRRVVRTIFETDPTFRICGEAENGLEGLAKAQELRPGLVILDVSMPVMNGIDAAREISRILPNVAIILFTVHSTCQQLESFLAAGISAIVDKCEPLTLLDVARDLVRPNAA